MSGQDDATRTWRVRHRTTYAYDLPVTDSYGLAFVRPRDLPWQRCLAHDVRVSPEPAESDESIDHFGNTRRYLHLTEPHRRLDVEATSVVEVGTQAHDPSALDQPWERCRPAERPDVADAWRARELVLPSPRVDVVAGATALARESFAAERPLAAALADLGARVHREFAYDRTATTVASRVPDVLDRRAGVCQDFAHLVVAGLRGLGLAARYVSGYLATTPAPGRERVVGADATHAWVACWVPDTGWVAVDPTNDAWVDERYVTVGWGRDYADVPPVRGVIFSDATTSSLEVSVDVAPAGAPAVHLLP